MFINIPSSSADNYKEPVASSGDLPSIAAEGDIRLTLDAGELYYFDGASWQLIAGGGGGGGSWGSITGTLSNQTDLQDALDDKADITSLRSYKPEFFTLSALDISNKFITLAETPTDLIKTRLIPINGVEQEYGVNFTVSGTTLSWNTLGLDGVLEENDKLIVIYN